MAFCSITFTLGNKIYWLLRWNEGKREKEEQENNKFKNRKQLGWFMNIHNIHYTGKIQ